MRTNGHRSYLSADSTGATFQPHLRGGDFDSQTFGEESRFGGRGCLDLLCPGMGEGGGAVGEPSVGGEGGKSTAFSQSSLGLRAALGLGLCDLGQIPSPLSGPQSPRCEMGRKRLSPLGSAPETQTQYCSRDLAQQGLRSHKQDYHPRSPTLLARSSQGVFFAVTCPLY